MILVFDIYIDFQYLSFQKNIRKYQHENELLLDNKMISHTFL